VNSSANDAGQTGTTVTLTSTTLNLSNEDWIGARFTNVTIPQGAYIISAYVAFTANNAGAGNSLDILAFVLPAPAQEPCGHERHDQRHR